MKFSFPHLTKIMLIAIGIVGGAAAAIAVTPLVSNTPTLNDTVVNFNELDVGVGAPVDGTLNIENNGKFIVNNSIPGDFNVDESDNLTPLPYGFDIISENAGIHSRGFYSGLRGRATQNAWLYGRIGVEGRVTAANPTSGLISTARGFAGYLEYEPLLMAPTNTENNIDIDTLPSSVSNLLQSHYVRISQGNPWGFYTVNAAKFNDDVEITGVLSADPGPLSFSDYTGPRSDPVLEVGPSTADLIAETITAEDFVATDDLSSQFFVRTASDPFNDHSNGSVFGESIYCPQTPTPSIRLGCGGGVVYDTHAPNHTTYLGVKQVSTRGCRAYARKPNGSIPGSLKAYAYCYRPE